MSLAKFAKHAAAQQLLRKMAGYKLPLLAGAGLVAGAATIASGLKKGREYKAGFTPGYIPQEH